MTDIQTFITASVAWLAVSVPAALFVGRWIAGCSAQDTPPAEAEPEFMGWVE